MKPITENTLFYGYNLIILCEHIPNTYDDLAHLYLYSIQTKIITLL